MIFDFDDFHAGNHRLDLLRRLRQENPSFRCTLFAVPGLGSDSFWESVPDWCELAVHGFIHDDSYECIDWTSARFCEAMLLRPDRFVQGFKAPGWQISRGCYDAALATGVWVADHPTYNDRRPAGLLTHVAHTDPEHWHGHIQNVCGNGLEECFPDLLDLVANADRFDLVSEVVSPWTP